MKEEKNIYVWVSCNDTQRTKILSSYIFLAYFGSECKKSSCLLTERANFQPEILQTQVLNDTNKSAYGPPYI